MTPYETLQLFTKTLDNLEKWMDKADAYAKERSFDVDVLAEARLAPDQFSFAQQMQAGCDQAKYAPLASTRMRTTRRSMVAYREGRTLTSELVTVCMPDAVCTSKAPVSVTPCAVPAVPSLSLTGRSASASRAVKRD